MVTWVTEGATGLYIVLGLIALLPLFAFFSTRRTAYLGGVAVVGLLILAVFLIDRFVETDREQVIRKTKDLAEAVSQGDIPRIETLLSRSVMYSGMNYAAVIDRAKRYLTPGAFRKVEVWNFEVKKKPSPDLLHCESAVSASGSFGPHQLEFGHVGALELVFVKEADGQWRVKLVNATTLQGVPIQVR